MSEDSLPIDRDTITALLITVFRLNGALLAEGDRLMRPLGLTSARWQVLGVVAAAVTPLPMASIARNMGLTRQAIRQVVNDLEAIGLVRFAPNPHHQRAHLVLLTPQGERANREAMSLQVPWASGLVDGLDPAKIRDATNVMTQLLARLNQKDNYSFEDDAT